MHRQLSRQMAQFSQREIHEASEQGRMTRDCSGGTWFRGFAWKLADTRGSQHAPAPARGIVAGV